MQKPLVRLAAGLGCLAIGAAMWLPALRPVLARDRGLQTATLLGRQLDLLEDPVERMAVRGRARDGNPEWDLMARTYLALAFANVALENEYPDERARLLHGLDLLVDDTLELERRHGPMYFLLPYAQARAFEQRPERSLFVDGQIAMLVAARQLVERRPDLDAVLSERVELIASRMEASPLLSSESYPDELWMFCNTTALAATRMADVVLGTDHGSLRARWVELARERLVDPETGLLVSSFTYEEGRTLDGPEGSSIFMVAPNLLLIDERFARDQYERARAELVGSAFGFAWAREWPESERGRADIDSGLPVPLVDASAGSSGMALYAAAAFGDDELLEGLRASLELAAFPIEEDDRLRYAASNAVGDAVMLAALTHGPLHARIRRGGPS
jgi:hypothetical protein